MNISSRIESIDVLRGFSILGILLINIYAHGSILSGYVAFEHPPLMDQVIHVVNGLFFDGRFRSLFCLLFGVGLAIQYQHCQKHRVNAKCFLKSRLNWLMVFGVVHGVFIFAGDIVLMYALSALLVLNKLNNPLKKIYKTAKVYLWIGGVLGFLFVLSVFLLTAEDAVLYRESDAFLEQYQDWFGHYSAQVIIQAGFVLFMTLILPFLMLWQAAGLMLLGVFLYRTRFFSRGLSSSMRPKIVFWACFTSVIDLISRIILKEDTFGVSTHLASISAIFVCLIYAHIIIKLVTRQHKITALFAAAGRLSLTLYISQSIVMAILLRWIMPEFNLTATRLDYLSIALVYIVLQLMFANVYFRYFRQGPLELLLRKMYVKKQT